MAGDPTILWAAAPFATFVFASLAVDILGTILRRKGRLSPADSRDVSWATDLGVGIGGVPTGLALMIAGSPIFGGFVVVCALITVLPSAGETVRGFAR